MLATFELLTYTAFIVSRLRIWNNTTVELIKSMQIQLELEMIAWSIAVCAILQSMDIFWNIQSLFLLTETCPEISCQLC